jgi:hypothetical protein
MQARSLSPDLPPLTGLAGAPPPFYEYFWIFGDGSFSREESPIHVYDQAGSYDAYLLATGNYDKGKKPKKKGKKVELMASTSPSQEAFPNVIKEQVKKNRHSCCPKPFSGGRNDHHHQLSKQYTGLSIRQITPLF